MISLQARAFRLARLDQRAHGLVEAVDDRALDLLADLLADLLLGLEHAAQPQEPFGRRRRQVGPRGERKRGRQHELERLVVDDDAARRGLAVEVQVRGNRAARDALLQALPERRLETVPAGAEPQPDVEAAIVDGAKLPAPTEVAGGAFGAGKAGHARKGHARRTSVRRNGKREGGVSPTPRGRHYRGAGSPASLGRRGGATARRRRTRCRSLVPRCFSILRHFETLRLCSSSVSEKTWPPVPSATK